MSAYVVDRNHIGFLVGAAVCTKISRCQNAGIGFRLANGEWKTLQAHETEELVRLGQMLWEENIRSVLKRYPQDTRDTMPGPDSDDFTFREADIWNPFAEKFDPVQVLKSVSCLEYQSCEHDAWEHSEAHNFCKALESAAIGALSGYETAEWGAPARPARKRVST